MDYAYLSEWAGLLLRWLHVLTAMCWVGASFYFMGLDQSLRPPADGDPLVRGEQWAVHGGGFYHKRKFVAGPGFVPAPLHWSKWEAYWTWLSGFSLFVLLYWLQAETYLIDPEVMELERWQAVCISLGMILVAWGAYDLLCRLPVGGNGQAMAVLGIAGLALAAWFSTRVFSGRGAYLQVGAMIGTIMAANVMAVIIPGQKKMVAAVAEGREIDPRWGGWGKQRSVHNNYMTLPVIFLMLSPHYPMFWQHPNAWVPLVAMALAGALVRQFFNLRHQGIAMYDYWLFGAVIVAVVAVFLAPPRRAAPAEAPPFAAVRAIVAARCAECHAPRPANTGFTSPPKGILLHSAAQIRRNARLMEPQLRSEAMPPGNATGLTAAERATLLAWIGAGAPR
ncbi:urate hydroxylase PuuD [Rhodovarius lipocyclicus]|uniref:urate hydroxylase PuuD n=1 Tax=Rhodovarius lipocyclicus TaxID=268410 RepID=UPI001358D88C|nr:urate hydroxylase PuuD [Rhodovarius lipocyclicus]